ncbi:IS3 family transposase [Streptomyces sp. NBC_01167]|uniref:IS3 family transposase n=1 Tax=Streptomyces sp. NBC_01167 TaxID=2903756 RepID=UPI0038691F12
MRDTELKELITEVYATNYRLYGARKIWRQLNRQGHAVARCTVERLMRELGIAGAVRGKRVLRSGDPVGIEQEMWALLALYQALRMVMVDAAESVPGTDPDRCGFTIALHTARDQVVQAADVVPKMTEAVSLSKGAGFWPSCSRPGGPGSAPARSHHRSPATASASTTAGPTPAEPSPTSTSPSSRPQPKNAPCPTSHETTGTLTGHYTAAGNGSWNSSGPTPNAADPPANSHSTSATSPSAPCTDSSPAGPRTDTSGSTAPASTQPLRKSRSTPLRDLRERKLPSLGERPPRGRQDGGHGAPPPVRLKLATWRTRGIPRSSRHRQHVSPGHESSGVSI